MQARSARTARNVHGGACVEYANLIHRNRRAAASAVAVRRSVSPQEEGPHRRALLSQLSPASHLSHGAHASFVEPFCPDCRRICFRRRLGQKLLDRPNSKLLNVLVVCFSHEHIRLLSRSLFIILLTPPSLLSRSPYSLLRKEAHFVWSHIIAVFSRTHANPSVLSWRLHTASFVCLLCTACVDCFTHVYYSRLLSRRRLLLARAATPLSSAPTSHASSILLDSTLTALQCAQ